MLEKWLGDQRISKAEYNDYKKKTDKVLIRGTWEKIEWSRKEMINYWSYWIIHRKKRRSGKRKSNCIRAS